MRKSSSFAAAALVGLFAFVCLPSSSCRPPPGQAVDSGVQVNCTSDLDCINSVLDAGNCDQGLCVLCQTSADCAQSSETCVGGTCKVTEGTGSGGTTGGTTGKPDAGDGGILAGQCRTSCDCTGSSKGPACISGNCGPSPDGGSCQRANDCPCNDICSAGHCEPKCTQNSDCKNPLPFCYLPQGQCGPCTANSNCPSGQACVTGACQIAPDGGCNAGHCCNNGDCPGSSPVCNPSTGVCGACTSSLQCSTGYACTSGSCVGSGTGGGCGANGCSAGQVCQNGACVTDTCNPPCGPPATCGANNTCVCPTNCNGVCASGQTCDMANCQCGVGSSGGIPTGGSFPTGGLGGSGGLPTTCTTSPCGSCPSGQTCNCFDGTACSASDVVCALVPVGFCQ